MARIYTKQNLLDQGMLQNAFNILDQRENAAAENRNQFANALGTLASEAANVGQSMVQAKEIEDRKKKILNDVEWTKPEYAEDPIWNAAVNQYARTGDIGSLTSVRSMFDAEKSRIAAEKKAEAAEKANDLSLRQGYQENYDLALNDWKTNKGKLNLLNPSSASYELDKLNLENAIKKNEMSLNKYGRLLDENYQMPEYEIPKAETSPVEAAPEKPVTYGEVSQAITDLMNKGDYNYTDAEVAKAEEMLKSTTSGTKEHEEQSKRLAQAKKKTVEKKPKYNPNADLKNLGSKEARKRLKAAGYDVKIVGGKWTAKK